VLGAAGQFLYREGSRQASGGLLGYLLNGRILLGVACYVGVMTLFVAAFKKGGALTVLYPVYASTFIWASLLALWLDGQPFRLVNVAGMALLVGGMYLMGK
jgi:multidrug transporter EmrE-like cation transporter